MSQAYLSSSHT